jgi:L-amino acid N-acyltransferase YncA
MDYNNLFNSYYLRYLGITIEDLNNGKNIFLCNQRDKPINNWYFQHLIITKINGTNVFSITPSMYEDFVDFINPFKNMDIMQRPKVLKEFFDSKLEIYTIRKMFRMTLDVTPKISAMQNNVVRLTKEILMDSVQAISEEEKEKLWQRKNDEVNQGRQYVILDDNKIASYCKVSNIDYNGGNLTVYTNEKYRNKGYGKLVSIGAIRWCIENEVVPIYWVDEKNAASIALAKSLGFKVISEELVVGTNTQIS